MAAETAKVDPGIEDAKPLLPGVGVLIDTEKLVEGAPDVYYLTVYGKRYYGTSPETTVNNVREYANAGLIKRPIKGPSFMEKARLAAKGFGTRKNRNTAASAKAPGPSLLNRGRAFFSRKPSSGPKPETIKDSGPSFWERQKAKYSRKPASGPAATPPKNTTAKPPKQTNNYQKLNKATPVTGNVNNQEEDNRKAAAQLEANLAGVPKPGSFKPGETVSVSLPSSKELQDPQARMIAAAKAKKEQEARNAAAAKGPSGWATFNNIQDGGARKHAPRHVTRRPKSMFSKPKQKLRLLAPTH